MISIDIHFGKRESVDPILTYLKTLEEKMALDTTRIIEEIEENRSLVNSLITATAAIVQELRDLSASGGADQATLDGLADQIETGTNAVIRSALLNTEAHDTAAEIEVEAPAAE